MIKCECGNEPTTVAGGRFYCYPCRKFVEPRLDFKPSVSGICKCGMEFVVGDVVKPDGSTIPCVIHIEPFCDQFRDLDVVDFLHWINEGNDA